MPTIDALHAEAASITGLTGFGPDDYLDGLEVLLTSYRDEAALTPAGRDAMHADLRDILIARQLSEAGWQQFPDHAQVKIERPVVIIGPPRTGTTNLHRLLTADPQHQGLEFWLGYAPQPRPDRATWPANPIFQEVNAGIQKFLDSNPGYRGIHDKNAAEAEECWLLTRQSLRSAYFEFTAHLPSYSAWLAQQDLTETYLRHRRNLQLIGLRDPGKRWVLKYSGHLFGLDALLNAYPDALIVVTHREPGSKVLASACSMVSRLTAGRSTVFEGEKIGPALLDLAARGLTSFRESRARHSPDSFYDVLFEDFAADPLAVVKGIYERLGTPLTDEARTHMDALRRADDRTRAHHYDLKDFGVQADEANQRLADLL